MEIKKVWRENKLFFLSGHYVRGVLEFFSTLNSSYIVKEMISNTSISKCENQGSESLSNSPKITQLDSTGVSVTFIISPIFLDKRFFFFQTQLHVGEADTHIYLLICLFNKHLFNTNHSLFLVLLRKQKGIKHNLCAYGIKIQCHSQFLAFLIVDRMKNN